MKRTVSLISMVMAIIMMLSFSACGNSESGSVNEGNATVSASGDTVSTGDINESDGVIQPTGSSDATAAQQASGTLASGQTTTKSNIVSGRTTMPASLKITTTKKNGTNTTKKQFTTKYVPTASNQKMVALSFDDGPTTSTTPLILDKLEKYKIVATFVVIGEKVNSTTKEIMQRQVKMGCEIGNHSYDHSRMSKMTSQQIKEEIEDTQNAVFKQVGVTPKVFRPPFIDVSQAMYDNIPITFISGIDAQDWDPSVTAAQRAEKILSKVKDGDIILLHDSSNNFQTVDALDTIIPSLQKQGYKFVTISELFRLKAVTPRKNKTYSNVMD